MLKHKNKIKRETLALHEHIEYFSVTFGVGSPDVSRNSRQSEVPTFARSPGTCASDCSLTVLVGSPDDRREFRPSKVPTFAGSSDTDLLTRTSDPLCTVFSVNVVSPRIYVGTPDVDLNGWIFTWSINTPLFTSNRYGLIS